MTHRQFGRTGCRDLRTIIRHIGGRVGGGVIGVLSQAKKSLMVVGSHK